MIFGMPTLIEISDTEETAKLAKELKLSFIELNMNLPQYQADMLEKNTDFLCLLKEKYGIYFTIHLDENLNVCDFNEDVRNAYIKTVMRTINVAKKLSVPVINMHINHGVHFTLPDRKVWLFEIYREHYLKAVTQFRQMCEKETGSAEIKICIENTNGFADYEKEAVLLLLESDVFGLTWDIGHSDATKNIDESFIIVNDNKLTHFHIHDSNGSSDHLTLGSGRINLKQRLEIAKQHHCRCVIETKTIKALRESAKWLSEKGYRYNDRT